MDAPRDEVPKVIAVAPDTGGAKTPTGTGKDLPNLDVVRSVAVVSVLASHISGALSSNHYVSSFGGFGVMLFFVHTSLVLMWSLERRPNIPDFYIRRIARIYPLAIAVLLIAVATRAKVGLFYASGPFFIYWTVKPLELLAHIFLVQDFFFVNFIVYPMWSLPIEVQMYAVLPVLFFFLRKNMTVWPLLLFWTIAVLFDRSSFTAEKMNLAVAVPYFLSGVIAYVGFSRRRAILPGWSFLVALAALALIAGHADWKHGWLPALALGLMLPSFRQLGKSLLTKTCWHIARYSYGIYLLHPFSLLLAFYVCRNRPWPLQYAVLFGSLAVFSVAAFHLIEAPCMKLGAKVAVAAARRFKMPEADGQATV